jgi:hypothetical protein
MTAAVAALAALFAAAPSALEVSLDIDRCPALPRDQVFQLVALELDARVTAPDRAAEPPPATPHTTRVEVACAGSDVELQVIDRLTGKRLTRTMALGARDTQVATRVVAIAVAELVLTSWMELTLPRAAAAGPPADGPPAAPELRRAAQERAQRHLRRGAGSGYVLAVGQALGPFDGVGLAWGGGLRFGWTPGARDADDAPLWRPGFDLELTGARNDARRGLGAVDISMWSAALRVSMRFVRGASWFDAGAGGRLGVARLEGTPADTTTTRGATLAGTWAGPLVYAGVGRRFWRLVATAGVEGGTVLRAVSGLVDDGPAISFAGRWLSGTLAIGWGG